MTNFKAFVIEENRNASTDYYLVPALSSLGCDLRRISHGEALPPADLDGSLIVFIRYIPNVWIKLIERIKQKIRGVIFFMDDDLLDLRASEGMPLRYRAKLSRLSVVRKSWLREQNIELWVSTPYLYEKYKSWKPRLVLPSNVGTTPCRKIFYHGSASHAAEIKWLQPVIGEVLERDESIVFEIVGGSNVYRAYNKHPRVIVTHPMKWPAYQAYLLMSERHIGLAPMLDSPFNRARSYTKFFDITSCGAVGIYTKGTIYADVVGHRSEGLVVDMQQQDWVDSILTLVQDENLRIKLLQNAREKVKKLNEIAESGYKKLFQ